MKSIVEGIEKVKIAIENPSHSKSSAMEFYCTLCYFSSLPGETRGREVRGEGGRKNQLFPF